MEPEIQAILEPTEQVMWTGKPDTATTMTLAVFIFLIAVAFGSLLSQANVTTCTINGQPGTPEQCSAVLHYIGTGAFIFGAVALIFTYWGIKVTTYVVTNKRAIIKSGFIGADIRSIYYEQIKSALVDVGLLGKIFNTGNIMMDTGRVRTGKNGPSIDYDKFGNVRAPYDVYRMVQEKLSSRRESLQSGRADFENAQNGQYKDYVQQVEKWRKEV